jgi:hypothetical protein
VPLHLLVMLSPHAEGACINPAPTASAKKPLLEADPLKDVTNARKISAVIVRGRYLPRQTLDERMGELMQK